MLNYIGELEKKKPAVLLVPGGMATSPAVFEGIGSMIPWQSAVIDWSRSEGPWDVTEVGKRLLELIHSLDLGPVIAAGYSAGGMIVMQAGISDEDGRIAGLLLSNTGPCSEGHGDPDLPERILKQWFSMELYEPFLNRCFAFPIDPDLKEKLVRYAKTVPAEVVYQAAVSVRQHDLRPQLGKIKCPVIVAHGILDKTRTMEHVKMLQDHIAGCSVRQLYGGHTIVVEDRKHWVEALKDLIREVQQEESE